MTSTPGLPGESYRPPADAGLAVIHRDDHLIVLDKPAGLLTVPGKGEALADCLEARVQARFPDALTVHRLDRDTSGLVVMAMGRPAQRHLGLQFERRKLHKTYLAVVSGVIQADDGEIALPLIADWPNRPLQKVCFEHGKQALTRWRVLQRGPCSTRLELEPHTGRSHQLRVHMKELGHPILGDPLYGDASSAPRLMLHAQTLELHHPADGARLKLEAPLPF
ncbi:MAG: RluA family pseudouridine synthase [Anderseniella sp.]|jgi:tRNA pseudouridine32 synthase/23S rRNA pseudouridine746 synthase|nr:RluA family pseudouridine synthase [Anderseniella sp.]